MGDDDEDGAGGSARTRGRVVSQGSGARASIGQGYARRAPSRRGGRAIRMNLGRGRAGDGQEGVGDAYAALSDEARARPAVERSAETEWRRGARKDKVRDEREVSQYSRRQIGVR